MCRKVPLRRCEDTTPAKDDSRDSSEAAWVSTCRGSGVASAPWMEEVSAASSGCTVSSESTNSRYPRGVGMRPPEVWRWMMRPLSSSPAITLRMVAGDRSRREHCDSVREPTGWPSAM